MNTNHDDIGSVTNIFTPPPGSRLEVDKHQDSKALPFILFGFLLIAAWAVYLFFFQ